MRVLFVTMQYGRSYVQGTERYLATLGRCLRERGHEVTYLAGDPLGLDGPRELGELVDERKGIYAYPTQGWTAVQGLPAGRLAEWLREHRPDVVHVANPAHVGCGAMQAACELSIPLVVTTMDFWWLCPKATLLRPGGQVCDGAPDWRECVRCVAGDHPCARNRLLASVPRWLSPATLGLMVMNSLARGRSAMDVLRWPRRREIVLSCLRSADAVVFPSRATQEAMGPHLGHGRWREIPYGLTGEWFGRPREESAAPGVPLLKKHPETFIVGYAGAMLPHKGPHLLLQAVRRLGWTRTRVRLAGAAGDQSYWSLLQRAAEGLNVEFLGRVPAERMPEFLRGLDVLAMTSVWPENLPFVVLEAQAAGVPVVGSRLAGVADQIGDERLLFEPGSVEGLAAALEHVARHREEVRPGRVSTAEEMTERTEAVYVEAVGRTTARE